MPGKKNFPFLGPVALCCRVEHVLAHGVELSTLLPTAGRESTLTLSGGDVCALAANCFRPRLTSRDFFDPFEGVVRGGPVDHLYPVHLLSFCGAGPSTRRKTSRRRMAALLDWESAIASNAATRTVPRFRPALPFRGNRISVVSLEEAQRSAAAAVYGSPARSSCLVPWWPALGFPPAGSDGFLARIQAALRLLP